MKKGGCADENKGGLCDKTACGYILYYTDRTADCRQAPLFKNQSDRLCHLGLVTKDLSWEELLSAYTEYVKSIEMTEDTKTVKPASIGEEASTVTAASISSDLSTYVLTLFQFGMIQASAKEMQGHFRLLRFRQREMRITAVTISQAFRCIIKAERNGFMRFLNLF